MTPFQPTPELEQFKAQLLAEVLAQPGQDGRDLPNQLEDALVNHFVDSPEINPMNLQFRIRDAIETLAEVKEYMEADHSDHPAFLYESRDPVFRAWLRASLVAPPAAAR